MKFILLILFLMGCEPFNTSQENSTNSNDKNLQSLINGNGQKLEERIKTPVGYERTKADKNSFAAFLRNLTLKPHNSPVLLYNGNFKSNQDAHIAVLNVSVGIEDMQQCADAVMRLRADYLFQEKKFDEISFNFTSGFKADYAKWRLGNTIQTKGSHCKWIPSSGNNNSAESYERYLHKVYSYAGSLSLSKQLHPVNNIENISAGDVWIRGGSPGHAVIVMDVATDARGRKIFLIAQSYMPAQQIHILKNPNNEQLSPWYSIDEIQKELVTPEYTFTADELKRF